MILHPVVDQVAARHPLDAVSAAGFFIGMAAAAALSARRPALGIAALIVAGPFAFYRDLGATTVTLPKVVLIGVALGLMLRRPSLGALAARSVRPLLFGAIAILAATALSVLAPAMYLEPTLRETLKAAEYLVLFAVVVIAWNCDPDENPIRLAFAGVLALVSWLAIAQEALGAPSGIWYHGFAIPRIAGPLEGPNQLSGYVGIALPVVVAFALAREATKFELIAVASGALAIVLTISRAGTFAAIVAFGLVVICSGPRYRRAVLTACAVGAAAGCALLGLWGLLGTHSLGSAEAFFGRFWNFSEVEDPGAVGKRSQLWRAAVDLWKAHPVLGIGAGNFEFEIGEAGFYGIRTHANSLFLQALVEGGLPLFAATLYTTIASILTFDRRAAREPLALGALGASAGFALHQVVDLLVFFPKVGGLWWIVLGLGAASLATAPLAARRRL